MFKFGGVDMGNIVLLDELAINSEGKQTKGKGSFLHVLLCRLLPESAKFRVGLPASNTFLLISVNPFTQIQSFIVLNRTIENKFSLFYHIDNLIQL